MAVEATVLIEFGEGVDSSNVHAIFELAGELNGDNTTFTPGSTVYLRGQIESSVVISEIVATHGSVSSYNSSTQSIEDIVDFLSRTESTTNTTSYMVSGSIAQSFYGRSGTMEIVKQTSGTVSATLSDISQAPVKMGITYSTPFNYYKLITPSVTLEDDESYPITIVMYLESATGEDNECDS